MTNTMTRRVDKSALGLSGLSVNRRTFVAGAGAAVVVGSASPAFAAGSKVWTDFWGYAIRGYDPVAYFDEGEPVEGLAEHEIEWNGASWRFSTAERQERFLADTAQYAPQFGGYCAWAVAQGYTASVVPEAWDIVDSKLYLNYSLSVQKKWRSDVPGHIAKANANWPEVLAA